MPFIKNLIIKTSDLTWTVSPRFDLDCFKDRENFFKFSSFLVHFKSITHEQSNVNEFQNGLKVNNAEFSKANEKCLKKALYFALRDFIDNLIKKYAEIVKGKKIGTDEIITELIMFNNIIFNEYNGFKKKVELQLDIQTKNLNGEYNRYKICQNCGKIWFLLYMSQNTLCGFRSNIKDQIFEKYIEYSVKFINGIITIQKIEIENKNTNTEKKWFGLEEEKLKHQNREGKVSIKSEGYEVKLK